nr:phage minor capsid protein [uncultured Oscillibacter sp.]
MPALTPGPPERELQKLVVLFLKAETDIINEISRLRSQGLTDYHAVAALERVQAVLRKLESDSWEYVPRMIEAQFYVRNPERARSPGEPPVKHLRAYQSARALTAEQTDIVQRLTQNLMGEIMEASATALAGLQGTLIGRTEPDVFRRVGLEQTALRLARGQGPYKALPGFVEALRREGVTAFVDKAGRRWSLHTYGAMASRTASRQAAVLSVLTADPEQDLYKISAHGTTCPLCAPYEGRVYSKSGANPDFPPLAAAFGKMDPDGPDSLANTWLNIHPNCLHALIPWTPAGRTAEEIRSIKDFSNPAKNPFDRDPRTEGQIADYRKKEAARRRWLEDYRQWERYRAAGVGPKTFETFRKYKLADGELYKLWKLDYRRQNDLLRHPEKALPGASTATAADRKFTHYFFGGEFKDGLAKGRAFSSRLGYNADNWQKMRAEILDAAQKYPAVLKDSDKYGQRYEQLVVLQGMKNMPANVLIGWKVVLDGATHMTTAHMEELK